MLLCGAFVGYEGYCAFKSTHVTMLSLLFFSTGHMAINADILKPRRGVFYFRGTIGGRTFATVASPFSC